MNNYRPGSAFSRLSFPNGQSPSGYSNGHSENFPRQFSQNNSRYPRQSGSSSAGIEGDWRDPRNRVMQEEPRPFASRPLESINGPPRDHNPAFNGPPRDHRPAFNGPPRDHHPAFNGPPREHHPTFNGPPREHHSTFNGPPREHHPTFNGPPREHHLTFNGPPREHHLTFNGPPRDHHPAFNGPPRDHRPIFNGPPNDHHPIFNGPPNDHHPIFNDLPRDHHPIFNGPPRDHQYLPNHFVATPPPHLAMATPPPHLAMATPPPHLAMATPPSYLAMPTPPPPLAMATPSSPLAMATPSPSLSRDSPAGPYIPPHQRRQPTQDSPFDSIPPEILRRQPTHNSPFDSIPSSIPRRRPTQDSPSTSRLPPPRTFRTPPAFFDDRSWDMESDMQLTEQARIKWMLNEFTDVEKAGEQKRITFIREVLRFRWSLSYAGVMGYQLEKEKLFPITDSLDQHENRGEGLVEFVTNRPHFFEECDGKLINRPLWFSKFVIWTVIFIMEHSARSSVWIPMMKLIDDFFPFLPLLTPDVPNPNRSDDLITIQLDNYIGKDEARYLYKSLPSIFEFDEEKDSIRVRSAAMRIPSLLSDFCVQKKFELGILVDRSRIMNFTGICDQPNFLQERKNKMNKRYQFKIKITEGVYTDHLALVSVPATDEENRKAMDEIADKLKEFLNLKKELMIHTDKEKVENFTIKGKMVPAYDSEKKFQFVVDSLVISGTPMLLGPSMEEIEMKNLITGPDQRKNQRMTELLRKHRAEHEKRKLSEKVKKEQQLITELEKFVVDDGISIKELLALEINDLPKRTKQLIDYCERRGHLYVVERGEEEDMDNYVVKKQSDNMHKIYMALAEMMCSAPYAWTRQKLLKSILDGRGGELLKTVCQPNDKEPDVLELDSILKGTNMRVIKDIHTFKLLYIPEEKIFVENFSLRNYVTNGLGRK